ncbi:TraB family protein [Candidatus Woesearchaeota archaeon]|jgi:pheromone shutdown-related protein TraB|nr:TraB family protein [Candidatus Woesearchaeota archaeon]MBT3438431.1 TraB family protein [Candidatus Woesearchaeota archaeon]MBT4058103.1 TraB family protein [Candidatus Woesearchaeota archaeon]MBT4208997.1 TraB family protein [Candidatus Woesearchaeota archaeon]MBT4731710.1 TraB family protein [Candidatus Woesearchaeota archaeon]
MKLQFKNIHFVGTSHISKDSIQEVQESISENKPKLIAIELDKPRLYSLISKKKRKLKISDIKKIGIKGYLFGVLGSWIEHKMGKITGATPGSEMKKAISIAKKEKIPIALIDQDISITLKNISKRITWKEKFRFLKEILTAVFSKNSKNKIEIDISKVPPQKMIEKLTKKMKKAYPSIYKSLITDRDLYMARNLYKISNLHKDEQIVAVLGAGHVKGIIKLLKKQKWPRKTTGKKQKK